MSNNVQAHSSGLSASWTATGASILNGMFGDYLHRRQNGLAIDMAFMHQDARLALDAAALQTAFPEPSGKLCIFIHGLCCNETSWRVRGATPESDTSYGALLQQDLGYTPLFVRYNTGLPIADNGAHFSALIQTLVANYPVVVDEIVLIGHSMGGLVVRSACEAAVQGGEAWVDQVSKAFYLGTPHDGADLEKLTHIASMTLNAIPNPITNVIGEVLNLRSRGIKDLRHGAPLANVKGRAGASRGTIPWLGHAQHYLIAGSLTEDPQHLVTQIFGDALVKTPRRRGGGKSHTTLLPVEHVRVFNKVHHMALAHDRLVYEQIRQWCAAQDTGVLK